MPFVTEIVTFNASEAYRADPAVSYPALRKVLESEGAISAFTGPQVEDPKVGYIFVVWETLDHHKRAMTDPSYADLTKLMAPVFDGHIEMVHVETNGNPGSALTAPITDLKYIALKEGKIKQDLLACFTGDESAAFVSNLGMFYGQAIEKPSTFVLFVPWESVEAHTAATAAPSPQRQAVTKAVLEIGNVDAKHAKIHQCP